jgi:hypothetical protein
MQPPGLRGKFWQRCRTESSAAFPTKDRAAHDSRKHYSSAKMLQLSSSMH